MGEGVSIALALLTALLEQSGKIAALVQAAQAAGQTDLTAEQWATVTGNDDSAEAALTAAIAAAKAAGK